LLRHAFANRSSPRVVTEKWLLEHEKLITGLKNKTWTNPQIKNHKSHELAQTQHKNQNKCI